MNGNRISTATVSILILSTLTACNLTGVLGLKAVNPLKSLSFSTTDNPTLGQTVDALIEGADVYLTLPYGVVEAQTPLKPTVKASAGYSIEPAGAFAVRDGETIRLVQGGTDQTKTYTLHVSITPQSAPPSPPESAIVSYTVAAAKNSALTADADAVVVGTNVYVTLPYAVVSGAVALTPSVTLLKGYTINPSGSYVLNDGMTLALTNTASGTTYNYILHVAAAPSSEYANGASLVKSFVVTKALNPSLATDARGIVIGSNIYISLPLVDIKNGVKLTPTVSLQSGYTISPTSSYAMSDGMKLTITQISTAAITDYTLHVGTSAGSMAFLDLSGPFYYDASGTKRPLSASNYSLTYDPATFTYTLTLNTDSFPAFEPYYVTDTQATLSRPWGFSTVVTPYNATVGGANDAIAGAMPPYTITVKSQDGSVAHTYTVDVVRTKSSWIGVSDVSAQATYAYSYTDTPSYDGTGYSAWRSDSYDGIATNNQAFITGAHLTGGSCYEGTEYDNTYSPSAGDSSAIDAGLGPIDTGTITRGATTIAMGASLLLSVASSYENLSTTTDGTRNGTFTVTGSESYYSFSYGGSPHPYCHSTGPYSVSYSSTPTLTVVLTRTYSPTGYLVPTQFTVDVPHGITVESVSPILDVASSAVTTSGNDNVVTVDMGVTARRLAGAVAGIVCRAEDGTTETLYVTVQ